jgi:hypothetical protein
MANAALFNILSMWVTYLAWIYEPDEYKSINLNDLWNVSKDAEKRVLGGKYNFRCL